VRTVGRNRLTVLGIIIPESLTPNVIAVRIVLGNIDVSKPRPDNNATTEVRTIGEGAGDEYVSGGIRSNVIRFIVT
jgi:hypothetical protein